MSWRRRTRRPQNLEQLADDVSLLEAEVERLGNMMGGVLPPPLVWRVTGSPGARLVEIVDNQTGGSITVGVVP